MTHILKTFKPNSSCAVPERYIGLHCEVVDEDKKLGLVSVAVWDAQKYSTVVIQVDKECVERT